jgi:hypothetical protein
VEKITKEKGKKKESQKKKKKEMKRMKFKKNGTEGVTQVVE